MRKAGGSTVRTALEKAFFEKRGLPNGVVIAKGANVTSASGNVNVKRRSQRVRSWELTQSEAPSHAQKNKADARAHYKHRRTAGSTIKMEGRSSKKKKHNFFVEIVDESHAYEC
jgi:hypothetical protein